MKKITIIIGYCLFSSMSLADINPPAPNYKINGETIIDENGEIDDDPEQVVSLTKSEGLSVASNLKQADNSVKLEWKKRQQGAQKRASLNPSLIKK